MELYPPGMTLEAGSLCRIVKLWVGGCWVEGLLISCLQVVHVGLVSAASIFEGTWRSPFSVGALSLGFTLKEPANHSGSPVIAIARGGSSSP